MRLELYLGFPQTLDVTNMTIFNTDFSILLHTIRIVWQFQDFLIHREIWRPNREILLGDLNKIFCAKLTAGGSNHNFSPSSTRCRYHGDFILCTSSKNASTTKVEYFFLNGFTILNKHRIFPAGRLNKPFVEILLNFQRRRNLLSRCINYILQS